MTERSGLREREVVQMSVRLFPLAEGREEDGARVPRDCDELLPVQEEPAQRGRGPETIETELRAGAGRAVGRSHAKRQRGGT